MKQKETKKTNIFYITGAIIIIILIIAFNNYGNNLNKNSSGLENKDVAQLASCLSDKGVIMAGTNWCPHCNNQKKMFGESFKLINFIDCDKNSNKCNELGVEGYPTWIYNGKLYPGEKKISELKEITGC